MPDVVIATYSSTEGNVSVYLDEDALNKAKTVVEARNIMTQEGFYAYTSEGVDYLKGKINLEDVEETHFFNVNRFVDPTKEITADQLYQDRLSWDGFVHQYNNEIPLNRPFQYIRFFFYLTPSLSEAFRSKIESRPWTELVNIIPDYPGEDPWLLEFRLPDEEFKKVYCFAKSRNEQPFYAGRLAECLIWESTGYDDTLDIDVFKTVGCE